MLATLLRASIEGAVLVTLAWIVTRAIRRLSPAARTFVWWAAGAKFVIALVWVSPIVLPILPATGVPALTARLADPPPAAPHKTSGGDSIPVARREGVDTTRIGLAVPWSRVLPTAWAIGLLAATVLAVKQVRQTRRTIANSTPADAETRDRTRDLGARLRLRLVPDVRLSDEVETPLVAGLLRPVVLLPAQRFARLDERQQRMAICHELAHIKRADLWLGCVPALAERLFFFHPLVHVAAREYALSREAACDAAVLDATGSSPQEYGRLLLNLGVTRRPGGFVAAGTPWSFGTLRRRIAMLDHMSPRSIASRLIAGAVVGLSLAALVPVHLTATAQEHANADAASPRELPPADRMSGDIAPSEQDAPRKADELNYVLFDSDTDTMMSGSMEDIRRARRFKQAGQQLLWFRQGGREYVVRDAGVLAQARALFSEVSAIGEEQGIVGGKQGEIGRLQGEIGAKQGEVGAEQGKIGERQGRIGDRQGRLAAQESGRTRTDSGWDAFERERRQLDDEMRSLDEDMRVLDRKMRELDDRMRVLDLEMQALDRKMEAASAKAKAAMRALLDRAIASGAAQPAR